MNQKIKQIRIYITDNPAKVVFFAILVILSLLRIFLLQNLNWLCIPDSLYDDVNQFISAQSIAAGNYLGGYGFTTLIKGISYPMFLAITMFLKLPYGLTFGCFILFSALMFVIALQPCKYFNNCYISGIVYLILIYNPVGFSYGITSRIYRNAMVPWATLLVLAGIFALWFRKDSGVKSLVLWIVLTGFGLGSFWYLREDSLWILPTVLVASAFIIIARFKKFNKSPAGFFDWILPGICPILILVCCILSVKYVNYRCYGIFTDNDRTSTACGDMMKLLYLIDDPKNDNPDVWLSRASLEKAMEASPTLNELKDVEDSIWSTRDESEEVLGDHVEWALRQRASNAGHYTDAVETNQFWEKVANELEAAYETGDLKEKEGIQISSQAPPLTALDITETLWISARSMWFFSTYDSLTMEIPSSKSIVMYGSVDRVANWENALRISIPRTDDQIEEMKAIGNYNIDTDKVSKKQTVAKISCLMINIYHFISFITTVLSVAAFIYFIINTVKKTRTQTDIDLIILGSALLLTAFTDLCVVNLFCRWMSRDPINFANCFYASQVYLLFCMFKLLISIPFISEMYNSYIQPRLSKTNN